MSKACKCLDMSDWRGKWDTFWVLGSWTVPTSLFSSFRIVLVCTPLVADLKSYQSDGPRVSRESGTSIVRSLWRMRL